MFCERGAESFIEENLDKVNWDNGTGSRSVKFEWRGVNSYLATEVMNDWFALSLFHKLQGGNQN